MALPPPHSPLCVAARLGRGKKKARKGRWEAERETVPSSRERASSRVSSRGTRFTRPNRRACSQAREVISECTIYLLHTVLTFESQLFKPNLFSSNFTSYRVLINSSFYLVCGFLIPVEKILWHADHCIISIVFLNLAIPKSYS